MEWRGQRWRHYTSIKDVKSADFQPQQWNCTFNVKPTRPFPGWKVLGRCTHSERRRRWNRGSAHSTYYRSGQCDMYKKMLDAFLSVKQRWKLFSTGDMLPVRSAVRSVLVQTTHTHKQLQQVIQAKEKWMATAQPVTTWAASVSAKLHWHMQLTTDATWYSEYSILKEKRHAVNAHVQSSQDHHQYPIPILCIRGVQFTRLWRLVNCLLWIIVILFG